MTGSSEDAELQPRDVRLRLLGETAIGLVHDYAQMLEVILWQAACLERETADPALRQRAALIRATAESFRARSQRTLVQVRPAADAAERPRQPLELSELVHDAVELWSGRVGALNAAGRHVRIERAVEGPLYAWGNAFDMRHVLNNLLSNALDALSERGRVLITALRQDERVLLQIDDDGAGMDALTLRQCTEPFFTTKEGVGCGLGLPNVVAMMRRQGGELTLRSEPGAGTRAQLALRRADAPAARAPAEVPACSLAPRAGGGLLLIDDELAVAAVLAEMCALAGFPVTLAHDAHSAVAAFDPARHQIVVVDLGLPDENGLWAAQRIRERDPLAAIVVLSGWHESALAASPPGLIDAHALKPIGYDRLAELLQEALAAHQLRVRRAAGAPPTSPPGLSARA